MTNQSKPVDVDREKAIPLEAGEPVEAPALSQLGGTFAERAAARKAVEKRIGADESEVEDKAVKKAATKRPAKKV